MSSGTRAGSGPSAAVFPATVDPQPVPNIPLKEPLTTDHVLVAAEARESRPGHIGLFAAEPIAAGTVCVVFGGFVTPKPVFDTLPDDRRRHSFQIADELFMVCGDQRNPGDFVNHSCEPTLGFVGEISLAARRDIAAGEQLTFDYAMCDSAPYDEFACECATPACRGKVTAEDWKLPALQQRYVHCFAPYLRRRINEL